MNETWSQHLISRRAQFDSGRVVGFLEARVASDADGQLCDLSHYGVLRVSGEDAATFLHAQLTNDVINLADGRAQWNGWCTPKGRLLVTFLIVRNGSEYWLIFARPLVAAIQKRLGMFVLRAKVKIEEVSSALACFAVLGAPGVNAVLNLAGAAPTDAMTTTHVNGVSLVHIDASRMLVIGEAAKLVELWRSLLPACTEVGASGWDLANIRQGVIDVGVSTQDQFVPQMANYDLIGGVSFKKGCYPGQEIVARTQYRGILKRRMVRVALPMTATVNAGDPVFAPEFGDQAAGQIALVAKTNLVHEALVVAQRESIAAHSLSLDPDHQTRLQILQLPYALPE